MKKQLKSVILALVLSLTTFTVVNAQCAFKKSEKFVEGTVSLTKETDTKATYSVSPTLGYFLTDRFAVGVSAEIGKVDSTKTGNFGVFGRCYVLSVGKHLKAYSQLGVASNSTTVGATKATSVSADLCLGANYFVSSRLALSMHLADLVSYSSQDSHSTLTVGFEGLTNPLASANFGVLYKF
jgi:hypothetical protein